MVRLLETVVDENDFKESFVEALKLHTYIMDNIQKYVFNNITLTFFDTYYFKIMRTDNCNGLIISIPPYNLNSCEIYNVNNDVPNVNMCVTFMGKLSNNLDQDNNINQFESIHFSNKNTYKSNNIDLYSDKQEHNYVRVMNYILHTLYSDEMKSINCDKVYQYIITKNNFNNFRIIKETKIIKILDNETQNGYVLSFFANEHGSQIKIELFQNQLYYGSHKTCYVSSSLDNIYNKLLNNMNNNVHNIPIKCCKIILPRYLEYNKRTMYTNKHNLEDDPINDLINDPINDPVAVSD